MHSTRRQFLSLAASATLIAGAAPALARAPFIGAVPPNYQLKLGDFEVTALADGNIDLDQSLFAGADKTEAGKLLEASFRSGSAPIRASVNAFVVNTGEQLIRIDSGTIQDYSPTLAKLPERLEALGFTPEKFDAVLLTHLHPDHVGATTNKDGSARFSKAELVVAEAEWKFWSDDSIAGKAPEQMRPFFKIATDAGKACGKSLRLLGKEGDVVKGITSVALSDNSARSEPGTVHFRRSFDLSHREPGRRQDRDRLFRLCQWHRARRRHHEPRPQNALYRFSRSPDQERPARMESRRRTGAP